LSIAIEEKKKKWWTDFSIWDYKGNSSWIWQYNDKQL